MGNPYEARPTPDTYEARDFSVKDDDEREGTPSKTSEDVPDNPRQFDVPTGSIKEILEWVDGDKDKAQAALDVEQADDKPRRGLVSELNEILSA